MSLLLFLLAAAQSTPAARTTGVATAVILPGAHINLEMQRVEQAVPAQMQRSLIVRRSGGEPQSVALRLLEFQ